MTRIVLSLIAVLSIAAPALPAAAAAEIGTVAEKRRSVVGTLEGERMRLQEGAEIFQNERIDTGERARARLRFRDDTTFTLSANASVTLDRFVFTPDSRSVVTLSKGAFRFAGGLFGDNRTMRIETPLAAIGIRGTEFWAGPIDGGFGVLLIEGVVEVSNEAGSVILDESGEGTLVLAEDVLPDAPSIWGADRVARALSTTAF